MQTNKGQKRPLKAVNSLDLNIDHSLIIEVNLTRHYSITKSGFSTHEKLFIFTIILIRIFDSISIYNTIFLYSIISLAIHVSSIKPYYTEFPFSGRKY